MTLIVEKRSTYCRKLYGVEFIFARKSSKGNKLQKTLQFIKHRGQQGFLGGRGKIVGPNPSYGLFPLKANITFIMYLLAFPIFLMC